MYIIAVSVEHAKPGFSTEIMYQGKTSVKQKEITLSEWNSFLDVIFSVEWHVKRGLRLWK